MRALESQRRYLHGILRLLQFVETRHAGASRLAAPRLREYGSTSTHTLSGPLSHRRTFCLDEVDPIPQLRQHLRFRTELGWDRKPHLDRLGHPAIWTKEVPRTRRMDGASRQEGCQTGHVRIPDDIRTTLRDGAP